MQINAAANHLFLLLCIGNKNQLFLQEAAALSYKKMLIFLISCFSVLLLSKSFLRPRKAPMDDQPRMCLFPWILLESPYGYLVSLIRRRKLFTSSLQAPSFFPPPGKRLSMDKTDHGISILDLPDLPLDCILEKLSPMGLCSMSGVCTSLRERCKSDYLWERHLNQKWGKVINDATYKEWQFYISSKRSPKFLQKSDKLHLFSKFLGGSTSEKSDCKSTFPPVNSAMSLYLALESGKFWFPAQVFNRENGHVGFMLSCYDAKLSYDSTTDKFIARYPAQGRSMIEEDIEWDRIRATSVDTNPDVLHVSDCLYELKPNDHIEIQWRRNKDFPYGWWYGVVGHLDTCIGNQFNCHCHINDTVIVEFKQYTSGSKWRKMVISRKDHREVGSEADGFYGGIRKLYKNEEIARWEQLQPDCQGAMF